MLHESDGPAFYAARETLERLKSVKHRYEQVRSEIWENMAK
jgi:hypothetical protein